MRGFEQPVQAQVSASRLAVEHREEVAVEGPGEDRTRPVLLHQRAEIEDALRDQFLLVAVVVDDGFPFQRVPEDAVVERAALFGGRDFRGRLAVRFAPFV